MAPHSSTLAWKIPWMEEPGGLQSMGSLRVGDDWVTSLSVFTFHALEKAMATHSSVLAWRIPGTGEPGGLSLGSHRVGHDWSDLAAAAAAGRFRIRTWITTPGQLLPSLLLTVPVWFWQRRGWSPGLWQLQMCVVTVTLADFWWWCFSHSVVSDSCNRRLLCPWGFPGKKNGSGLPFPSPVDLPNPGIKPRSPALASGFFTTNATWEALSEL